MMITGLLIIGAGIFLLLIAIALGIYLTLEEEG
jgi:hypothetical protein